MARRKFRKIRNAQQLSNKLGQFIAYANAHLGTLTAINAGDITAMTTLKTNIDASIAARIAAVEAAKQATIQENNDAAAGNTGLELRIVKLNAQATPVADTDWQGLGYPAPDTDPTRVDPNPPLSLVMTGYSNGENRGVFDRNGNRQGTVFILYARTAPSAAWVQVATSTTAKIKHTGQTPGVHMEYQVVAERGGRTSGASNVVVVYP